MAHKFVELQRLKLEKLRQLQALERRLSVINVGLKKYHDDPVGFARDCFNWHDRELAPYQADILELLKDFKRASFRSLRGAGKSCVAAIATLWFALTRDAAGEDWKIVSTAGAWNQLRSFLWPEIHKWAGRLKWDMVRDGRPFTRNELKMIGLKLEHGHATAAACTNAGLIEGAHADELMFVFDEAKLIPASTFDSAEGAMNTGNCYALMLSTPGEPAGRFYEIQTRQAGYEDWGVKVVTLEEVLAAGQINTDWVDQRRKQWGEGSALFHNHVLGEFYAADEDCVIPLRYAEAAMERWKQWDRAGRPGMNGRVVIACDVARYGTDKTCIAERQGWMIHTIEQFSHSDTMTTTGRIRAKLTAPSMMAVVDVIGIGAGVVDRLRELGRRVVAFNSSAKPMMGTHTLMDGSGEFGFINLRAAAWWGLREELDPSAQPACDCPGGDPSDHNCWKCCESLGIPEDIQLMGDLTAPHWKITSGSKIQIESKDDIRKRLGRSTDMGDTVVMAAWYRGGVSTSEDDIFEWSDEVTEDAVYGYDGSVEGMY